MRCHDNQRHEHLNPLSDKLSSCFVVKIYESQNNNNNKTKSLKDNACACIAVTIGLR